MSDELLLMDGLAVAIRGRRALRDVHLAVPRGRCVALVGETGSGKSMTCRTAVGLLGRVRAEIVGGVVRFGGQDVTHLPQAGWGEIRGRRIGLIPQHAFSALDPIIRVGRPAGGTGAPPAPAPA